MKNVYLLFICSYLGCSLLMAQENAAPSMHIYYAFNTNVALMMNKVKVTQSAMTSYFASQNWLGRIWRNTTDAGYEIMLLPIFIASQWNPDRLGYKRIDD